MQLLILLAMLLAGDDADDLLKEVRPLLKNMGGGDIQKTLKQAEELCGMVTALQSIGGKRAHADGKTTVNGASGGGGSRGFALAPIADIADGNVICRMTKYIADNP